MDIRARWATICWLFARVFLRIESEQNFVNFGSNITTSYLFAILNMTRRVILTILYLNILKQNFLTTLCRNRGILPRLLRKRYPPFSQKNPVFGNKIPRKENFDGKYYFWISKFVKKSIWAIRTEFQRSTRFSFFKFHHDSWCSKIKLNVITLHYDRSILSHQELVVVMEYEVMNLKRSIIGRGYKINFLDSYQK